MKYSLRRITESLENQPFTLATFAVAFFALIFTRLLIENMLGLFGQHTLFFIFFEFTHTFLFFLCAFLLMIFLVRFAGNVNLRQAANVLLFGFLIILTPPIIDTVIFHGTQYWSFYEFDGFLGLLKRFVTLFGDSPQIGITYGVRVEVAVVTLALGLYAFIKSRRAKKALLVSLSAYALLFILGTFPSWLTLCLMSFQKNFLAISGNDVAALFLAPENIFALHLTDLRSVLNVKMSLVYGALDVLLVGALLGFEYPKYFIALWKNARLPQVMYHGGLLFLGMALAFFFSNTSPTIDFFHISAAFVLLAGVESAWLASVIANDCYDINIDRETNPSRPLIQNAIPFALYKTIGILFFVTSLLLSGIISFSASLLLLSYQALAWLYSGPPLRLKRFPLLATMFAALAGILILITGFLAVSPENGLRAIPLPILFFLFAAYALSLPIKDFKDVRGDALDHVYTLPVILGIEKAQLLIGSFLFLFYVSSPFVLGARSLFLPALVFGGLAFWSIQKGNGDDRSFFSFRKLPGIVLAITILYGLVILSLLF